MRLGGPGQGDDGADRLDLPDVVAELAAGIGAGPVVAVAEVSVPGGGIFEEVPDDDQDVIAAAFDEAERRDPGHKRECAVLIDGNNTQIEAVTAAAARRGVTVTIVIDFIHVLEYRGRLAHCHRDRRGCVQAHREGQNGHNGRMMGLEGAEDILKLRAVIATGDFDDYWRFHLRQDHKRTHKMLYTAKTSSSQRNKLT